MTRKFCIVVHEQTFKFLALCNNKQFYYVSMNMQNVSHTRCILQLHLLKSAVQSGLRGKRDVPWLTNTLAKQHINMLNLLETQDMPVLCHHAMHAPSHDVLVISNIGPLQVTIYTHVSTFSKSCGRTKGCTVSGRKCRWCKWYQCNWICCKSSLRCSYYTSCKTSSCMPLINRNHTHR